MNTPDICSGHGAKLQVLEATSTCYPPSTNVISAPCMVILAQFSNVRILLQHKGPFESWQHLKPRSFDRLNLGTRAKVEVYTIAFQ